MSDVIVVGAGPAGLATAACLRRLGVRFRLVDRRGATGGAYRVMDPDLLMTSPSRLIRLPGLGTGDLDRYATAGAFSGYLARYAHTHELAAEPGIVEAVASAPPGYRVSIRSGDRVEQVHAPAVVFATGMFDTPVIPEIAGQAEVVAIHSSVFRAAHLTAARRVVVIGGASSAIEIAEAAARHGCKVTIAVRKLEISRPTVLGIDPAIALFPVLSRISPTRFCEGRVTVPGVDRGFGALRKAGAIEVAPPVTRIDGSRCTFADRRAVDADLVVFATGYRYTLPALPADVPLTPRGIPRCDGARTRAHAGLWFVGLPCARSAASQYLYGISRDAEFVARRIATR